MSKYINKPTIAIDHTPDDPPSIPPPIDERRFATQGPCRSIRILQRNLNKIPPTTTHRPPTQLTPSVTPSTPKPCKTSTPSSKFKSYQAKLHSFYNTQLSRRPPQCTSPVQGFKRRTIDICLPMKKWNQSRQKNVHEP